MPNARRIYKQLKGLLLGTKSNELLVFCFFLTVSFGFWLLQALNENLDREVQVELELVNIPPEMTIIDSLPASLTVSIHDKGLTLARHSFSSIFRPNLVEIDFNQFYTGQAEAEVDISNSDMTQMIRRIFNTSTKIQSFHPDALRFAYNRRKSRMLPVKLSGSIKPSLEHYIQEVHIEPDSVLVFALASVLDTIQAVYTDALLLEDLQKDGHYQIGLRKQKLMRCEPNSVGINVEVGYYTEKTVQVPVRGVNFPADKKLRTFPAQVSITFRVESGRYQKVKPEDFVLTTSYEELLSNTESSKLRLHVKTPPKGVSDVRISPKEVDYLIEQAVQ